MGMPFNDRLKLARKNLNLSQPALAKKCGLSGGQGRISHYEAGRREPDIETLAALAIGLEVSVDWLLFGGNPNTIDGELVSTQTGIKTPAARHNPAVPANFEGDYEPDKYIGIRCPQIAAAAFDGVDDDGDASLDDGEPVVFKRVWIEESIKRKPDQLVCVRVKGDSMSPTLECGDILLVDLTSTPHSAREIKDGHIYVLRYEGKLRMKRLQVVPGGMMRILSDNNKHMPLVVDPSELNQTDAKVIGRVIWYGRTMPEK
jgi:phage repressor protein C with HTH and peptisase S24 domain